MGQGWASCTGWASRRHRRRSSTLCGSLALRRSHRSSKADFTSSALFAPDADLSAFRSRPNMQNAMGVTPLLLAAEAGREDVVKALLGFGADPDSRFRHGGCTPLMAASAEGHLQCVELLLGNGADPNARDSVGNSSLTKAVAYHHERVIEALLAAGADPHVQYANTLANVALGHDTVSPLGMAIVTGNDRVVHLMLRAGAQVDTQYRGGYTPLLIAAEHLKISIMETLLEAGADPKACTDKGKNALATVLTSCFFSSNPWSPCPQLSQTGLRLRIRLRLHPVSSQYVPSNYLPLLLLLRRLLEAGCSAEHAMAAVLPLFTAYCLHCMGSLELQALVSVCDFSKVPGFAENPSQVKEHLCEMVRLAMAAGAWPLLSCLLNSLHHNWRSLLILKVMPELEHVPSAHEPFAKQVKGWRSSPPPLFHLAKVAVRENLAPGIFSGLDRLPLPRKMRIAVGGSFWNSDSISSLLKDFSD